MPDLKFNKKIYKKEAIQEAIQAYSGLADFKVSNLRAYTLVRINRIEPEFEDIFSDEFANYVLGASKKWI